MNERDKNQKVRVKMKRKREMTRMRIGGERYEAKVI